MLDFLLWNKIARIIAQLADTLHISTDRSLQIFYDSDVCRMLHDKDLGLHLMSDTYCQILPGFLAVSGIR